MKATGIIRRIDELGRIVIPKEIRKSLRIKEGESLEIFVDVDENIILKKHSLIKKISDFAQDFADSVYSYTKHNIIVTDNNSIVAVSGNMKKEYLNKPISLYLETKINERVEVFEPGKKKVQLIEDKNIDVSYTMSPIIVNGDSVGMVIILNLNEEVTELDYKIVQILSDFFRTHLQ